jgi:hypothetical protein
MSDDQDDAIGAADAALAAFSQAYERVLASIDAISDPVKAFEQSTRLTNALKAMNAGIGEVRAGLTARVWEAEKLSLSALAKRFNISKTRADQLVNAAKAAERTGDRE